MNVFYNKGKEKLEDELNIVKILKQLIYLNFNLKLQKLDIGAIRLIENDLDNIIEVYYQSNLIIY